MTAPQARIKESAVAKVEAAKPGDPVHLMIYLSGAILTDDERSRLENIGGVQNMHTCRVAAITIPARELIRLASEFDSIVAIS